MISQIGAGAVFIVDGKDVSTYLRTGRYTSLLDVVQNTKFDPANQRDRYHSFIVGLRGGAVGFSGDMPTSEDGNLPELQGALGTKRDAYIIFNAPSGAAPGNLARIGRSLQSNFGVDTPHDGLIAYSADFEKTAGSPGVLSGLSLWTPYGSGSVAVSEEKSLVATAASGNGVFALPATLLGAGGNLTVTPGMTAAALQTAIRAIAGYNNAGVTVAGSSTAPAGGTSEVQRLETHIGGNNGFTITFNGQTTATLSSLPTAGQIQAALEALANIAPGDVTVDGAAGVVGVFYDGDFTLTFGGALANQDLPEITASLNAGAAEGSALTPSTTTAGSAGTGGNGTYLVTLGGALANTDIADWPPSGGNGWTSATTRQGGTISSQNVITATGNGTTVRDIPAASSSDKGLLAVLQVTSVSGATPSLTVVLEHAPNSGGNPGTWATLGTFAAMTAVGAQILSIAPGVTINPFLRVRVGAISGSFVFAAGYARRF